MGNVSGLYWENGLRAIAEECNFSTHVDKNVSHLSELDSFLGTLATKTAKQLKQMPDLDLETSFCDFLTYKSRGADEMRLYWSEFLSSSAGLWFVLKRAIRSNNGQLAYVAMKAMLPYFSLQGGVHYQQELASLILLVECQMSKVYSQILLDNYIIITFVFSLSNSLHRYLTQFSLQC